MADFDSIPEGVVPGTLEYWKYRSRQWQKRCLRAESEKTEIIAELNALKVNHTKVVRDQRDRRLAVASGDVQPVGRDYTPRPL